MPSSSAAMTANAWVRSARLASLPLYAGAVSVEGLARRALGQDPDSVRRDLRKRTTDRTRRTLGELKGGALKAGQLLSTVEMLFPPDPEGMWRSALQGLQEDNPSVPFAQLRPVLEEGLGRDWPRLLPALDEEEAAAASIGQVHRGTWHDGRDVAVKIQYPGIREALAADLRAVSWATRGVALVARGLSLPPLVDELRTRLVEELDYVHEGRVQQAFARSYLEDPEAVVPQVVHAAPRVLVTEWLEGTPLVRLGDDGSPESAPLRDLAGERYQRFLLSGPERVGLLHTDPHPGNFRVLADGRLGVFDFGSSLTLPEGMPSAFGRLMRVMLGDDPDAVLAGLRAEGFVRPDRRVDAAKLVDYLSPFSEPARHEVFTYSREWLAGEFARVNDPRNPEFGVALQLDIPADLLFTHRVWLGVVGVLSQLGATVPVRSELTRWLPGFAG